MDALVYGVKCRFQHYLSNTAVVCAPFHAFLKFCLPVLRTVIFSVSPRLLCHIHVTIVETFDSDEKGIKTCRNDNH